VFLWNAGELKRKLEGFRQYCNAHRMHISLNGDTPSETAGEAIGSCANLTDTSENLIAAGCSRHP